MQIFFLILIGKHCKTKIVKTNKMTATGDDNIANLLQTNLQDLFRDKSSVKISHNYFSMNDCNKDKILKWIYSNNIIKDFKDVKLLLGRDGLHSNIF